MDIEGEAILNGFKLILITFVYGEKDPSVSEAKGALNNDCSVSCFVETLVFCLVLMIQVLEALPSSGAFSVSSLKDWVPLHKAGCMAVKCRYRSVQGIQGCADKT